MKDLKKMARLKVVVSLCLIVSLGFMLLQGVQADNVSSIQTAFATDSSNGSNNLSHTSVSEDVYKLTSPYIVGLKKGIDVDEFLDKKGFNNKKDTKTKKFKSTNALTIHLDQNELDSLQGDTEVLFVEVDAMVEIASAGKFQDDHPSNQFRNKDDQTTPWGIHAIGADIAHLHNYKGQSINIAVLDTGVADHPDLKVFGGISFVEGVSSYLDDHGHGTHVAGTIAASDNKFGVIGGAPKSKVFAVKVLDGSGQGSYSQVIQGIEWAIDQKVDMISISFGGVDYSQALHEAIRLANDNGILVIAAAGNRGPGEGTELYPALFPEVVSVGAVTQSHQIASYSSRGSKVELVAPGTGVLSTTNNQDYGVLSGTSMAAPHVTSAAALLWAKNKNLTHLEVKNLLFSTATPLGDSTEFGHGLVNVAKGLELIEGPITPVLIEGMEDYQIPTNEAGEGEVSITGYDYVGNNQTITAGQSATVSVKLHEPKWKVYIGVFSPAGDKIASAEKSNVSANVPISYTWYTSSSTPAGTYTIKYAYSGTSEAYSDYFYIRVNAPNQPQPPSAPTGLYSTNITTSSIQLNWSSVSGASGYKIRRNGQDLGTITGTSYNFTGLSSGTQYKLEVAAYNSNGTSSYSYRYESTLTPPPAALPAPQNLRIVDTTDKTITISWNAVPGASYYSFQRNGVDLPAIERTTATSYTFKSLNPNGIYILGVAAMNSNQISSYSNITGKTLNEVKINIAKSEPIPYYANSFADGESITFNLSISGSISTAELYIDNQFNRSVLGQNRFTWKAPDTISIIKPKTYKIVVKDTSGNVTEEEVILYPLIRAKGSMLSFLPKESVPLSPFHEDDLLPGIPLPNLNEYFDRDVPLFRQLHEIVLEGKSNGSSFIEAPIVSLSSRSLNVSYYCDDAHPAKELEWTKSVLPTRSIGGAYYAESYYETMVNVETPDIWSSTLHNSSLFPKDQLIGYTAESGFVPSIFSKFRVELSPNGNKNVTWGKAKGDNSHFPFHYVYLNGELVGGKFNHPPTNLKAWQASADDEMIRILNIIETILKGSPSLPNIELNEKMSEVYFEGLLGECARQRLQKTNSQGYNHLMKNYPWSSKILKTYKNFTYKSEIVPFMEDKGYKRGAPGPGLPQGINKCDYPGCPGQENNKIISFHSPVNVHIYDSLGNHTGPRNDGTIEYGISNVSYSVEGEEKYVVIPKNSGYQIKLEGYDDGLVTINTEDFNGPINTRFEQYYKMPVTVTTSATIEMKDSGLIVKYDLDGSGDLMEIAPTMVTSGDDIYKNDHTAPTTSIRVSGKDVMNKYYEPIEVLLDAIDDQSGVHSTEYSLDGGVNWLPYHKIIYLYEYKEYQLSYRSIDFDQNQEETKTQIISIIKDTTPPTTIIELLGTEGAPGYYRSEVQIELSAEDDLSGVRSIQYSLDGGNGWSDYTDPFILRENKHYVIGYRSVDHSGNIESMNTETIVIDTEPPALQAIPDHSANPNDWYNSNVTIQFKAEDKLSGIEIVTPPVTVSTEGMNQVIKGYATDRSGNITEATFVVNMDKTNPTVPTITPNETKWSNKAVDITITDGTDDLSGVQMTHYKLDENGEWLDYHSSFSIATEGVTTIYAYTRDQADNVSDKAKVEVKIDKTAPTSSIQMVGEEGQNNWYVDNVSITLTVTDQLSGVRFTEYSLDNGVTWEIYENPIELKEDHIYVLSYRGVDHAGNMEETQNQIIRLDKTKPDITVEGSPQANEHGWNNSDVELKFTATDLLSGIQSVTSDQVISKEGASQTFIGEAVDLAGNKHATSITLNIDKTSPQTTIHVSGQEGKNNWYTDDVTIVFTAEDNISGVSSIEYSFDMGATWKTYVHPIELKENHVYTLLYRSLDRAGNIEEAREQLIRLDRTAPKTTIEVMGEEGQNNWYVNDVTITLIAEDNLSEVDVTEYSFDGGTTWYEYTTPLIVNQDEIYTLFYRSIDRAGNIEQYHEQLIKVDQTQPELTYTLLEAEYYWSDSLTIHFSATDHLSGVQIIEADINGEPIESGKSFTLTQPGMNTVTVRAIDNAGNEVFVKQTFDVLIKATIDLNPSVINISKKKNENSASNAVVTVMIQLPKEFDVSLIMPEEVTINGLIKANQHPVSINKAQNRLMLKFDRSKLEDILKQGENIKITIDGVYGTEIHIRGFDTITVK